MSFNWRIWAEEKNLKYEYDKLNDKGLLYFSWIDPVKMCYLEVDSSIAEKTLEDILLQVAVITKTFETIDALQNDKFKCQGHLKICII